MKSYVIIFICLFSLISCGQGKQSIQGQTEFQREINAEFKDASTSPLKDKDRTHFSSLEFFPVDSTFVVNATLERTPDTEYFEMQTTTSRKSKERVFGILTFNLKGKSFELKVYQGQDLMKKEGFEDYLFLPFLDDTNSEETYGGGRYIDLRIPEGDQMTIDFNKAYNPYCAYNEKYSCPIVPRENYLEIKVRAGVKVFKKH